ncbi:uncharacterized protein LOC141889849 isoform X2 [Acropora palmata]|uniref:uncharacterized protein LOC141889849 isoform X2 n=1 Tax=Acropora palmata TaxID=6131 RepID=UPI003D9FE5E0
MWSSEDENTQVSSEDDSEYLSDASKDSFVSTKEDFVPYDESREPVANEDEAAQHAMQVAEEEEEEQMLLSRFCGEVDVREWCRCSNCSLTCVVQAEECRCCMEVNRCIEKMEEVEKDVQCITMHPGFGSVCLDRWVLQTAGIGLKTKLKKSYTTMLTLGYRAEAEFLRSVAYRQFVHLVWEYVGKSNRLPLPCCVYNAIRSAFLTAEHQYHGYEEEDDNKVAFLQKIHFDQSKEINVCRVLGSW